MKIGCLTTINEPNLSNWLRELESTGVEVCVIVDEKKLSDQDVQRFQERTGHR